MASKNYTIKRDDTLQKIYQKYSKYGLKSKDDILAHTYNKINCKYWPEGISTPDSRLPEGYPLYIPCKDNVLSVTVKKDKPKQTFVEAPTLKHLRLKINFYDNFDVYGWLDRYHWEAHTPTCSNLPDSATSAALQRAWQRSRCIPVG